MRDAFIKHLLAVAANNPRIWLLNGDLGYSVLDPFRARFPERYLNVGVAEQNMAGVATGIAMSGNTVLCYSIANFPTLRCLEQIRNDVCYHGADVKIVAVGGGLAYGQQGYSHHAIEDLAVMAALPQMTVTAPGDPEEVEAVLDLLLTQKGPAYLRLGKAGEPRIHASRPSLIKGQPLSLIEGREILLLSTGGMLATAHQAAEALHQAGRPVGLASMPFLKPIDDEAVLDLTHRYSLVCTLEEHGPQGGLRDAVARILAEQKSPQPRLHPFYIRENSIKGRVGTQEQLRAAAGLDAKAIMAIIEKVAPESGATSNA